MIIRYIYFTFLYRGFSSSNFREFSRLKPVIIFKEIVFLKSIFKHGLFCCYRNQISLEKTIKKIINNYEKTQISIYENKLYSFKDFQIQMKNILNKN